MGSSRTGGVGRPTPCRCAPRSTSARLRHHADLCLASPTDLQQLRPPDAILEPHIAYPLAVLDASSKAWRGTVLPAQHHIAPLVSSSPDSSAAAIWRSGLLRRGRSCSTRVRAGAGSGFRCSRSGSPPASLLAAGDCSTPPAMSPRSHTPQYNVSLRLSALRCGQDTGWRRSLGAARCSRVGPLAQRGSLGYHAHPLPFADQSFVCCPASMHPLRVVPDRKRDGCLVVPAVFAASANHLEVMYANSPDVPQSPPTRCNRTSANCKHGSSAGASIRTGRRRRPDNGLSGR